MALRVGVGERRRGGEDGSWRTATFFSAATGLIVIDPDGPQPRFPLGGVMFVGHNLDSNRRLLCTVSAKTGQLTGSVKGSRR